jgi:hypothetical protein
MIPEHYYSTTLMDNAYLAYLNQFTLVIQAKPRSNEDQM